MNLLFLRNVLLLSLCWSLSACAASGPAAPAATQPADTTKKTTAAAPPLEDLSRYRPVFPAPRVPAPANARPAAWVPPTHQVNDQIEQRLRDQAVTNQQVKYAQGFRILVYVGLEREDAMRIRREVISRYPDETDYIAFKQPLYRLWIGDYLTRLEAEAALLRLLPLAPKAELQPAQVVLNKTTF